MTATSKIQTIAQAWSKIAGIVKRSVITRIAKDNGDFQTAQITYMGKTSDSEILWAYGTYGSVPVNSLCVTLSVGAHEEDRVTFPSRSRTRTRRALRAGEVGFGNPIAKSDVFFDADGNVIITVPGDKRVTVVGDCQLTVSGNVTVSGGNVTINATTTTLNGQVSLGGSGGLPIARVGDAVSGGVITTGSATHTAT